MFELDQFIADCRAALAVDKLCEAANNTRNHRYSSSRGIPKLRQALADLSEQHTGKPVALKELPSP